MHPTVTCKQCGFQVAIEMKLGQLISLSPDQTRMTKRCGDQGFAYECSDLTSALLITLENEARFPQMPLGLKMSAQRAERSE
jgi:hypothetical protein